VSVKDSWIVPRFHPGGIPRPGQQNNQARVGQGNIRGGRDNVEGDRRQEKGGITCRRCWQEGHMHNECRNLQLCYFCHDSGHMSPHCREDEAQKQGLTMYGFGLPRMGFYHI
jgi:hypothetical protein